MGADRGLSVEEKDVSSCCCQAADLYLEQTTSKSVLIERFQAVIATREAPVTLFGSC